MFSLDDLHAFVRVADTGSFTAAGDQLALPKSTVSRRVHRLEENLGVQLLNRTTRAVRLTEVGRVLHARYARSIEDLVGVEQVVADEAEEPSGTLKVSLPGDLGTLYGGSLAAGFRSAFPQVRLQVGVTDRMVDLVDEGVDVALRIFGSGVPDTASLIGRRLGRLSGRLFASRDYVERRGAPDSPDELAQHDYVRFGRGRPRAMKLKGPAGAKATVTPAAELITDNFFVVRDAVKEGAGIGWLPCFLVERDELVTVLPDWTDDAAELWIVWPTSRHVSPAVRAFVDFAVERLGDVAWEPRAPTG
jgi:DNA-binding transcriptional LysR family regulator